MIHFIFLIPYAAEIWSSVGLIPDPSVNLTFGVFPNILHYITSATAVTVYVGALALLSIAFLIGFQRPIISVLLWYGWASLFDRNNLINNPGIPYVGWLLLCCAVIPKGEPWSIGGSKNETKWEMPKILFYGAWALMAIGYTISGFDKFASPSWRDGTAIFHLLENPLARDYWLRDILVQLPLGILKIKTWAVLFIEMAFLPLVLFRPARKWIWLAMIMMHLGILMIVDFADLTLGMLMIHWFTFDSDWLKAKPKQSGILFFDGVCAMCNGLVTFMMAEDHNETLRFTALQGETAADMLDKEYLENLNTIVYVEGNKTYTQSSAIIRAVSSLGGIFRLVLIIKIIPKFVRDKVYNFIAANRYAWFGKKDACRIATKEERDKILP